MTTQQIEADSFDNQRAVDDTTWYISRMARKLLATAEDGNLEVSIPSIEYARDLLNEIIDLNGKDQAAQMNKAAERSLEGFGHFTTKKS